MVYGNVLERREKEEPKPGERSDKPTEEMGT